MKVLQTITRSYPNGSRSTWVFGRLGNGSYAAKGLESGRKCVFKSYASMRQRLRYMTWTLGFKAVDTQPKFKQLCLALG